jgi:hypothetical protein
MVLPRVIQVSCLDLAALRNGPSLMQTSEAAEFPEENKPQVISSVERFRGFLK